MEVLELVELEGLSISVSTYQGETVLTAMLYL